MPVAGQGTGRDFVYTLPDLLERRANEGGVAVVEGEVRLDYAELLERARRIAALLRESGLRPGDRVALHLRKSARAVAAMFGTHLAGGVAVFLNDRLRAAQVDYVLAHAGASIVLTERALRRLVPTMEFPPERTLDLDAVAMPAATPERVPRIGEDLALLVYTSGSTGMPKGIMLSHRNVVEGARTVSDYLGLSARDVVISLLPFSFDYGLNQVTSSLLVGATVVIQRSMFPGDICRTIVREGVTGMAGVPLLWSQLAQRTSPFLRTELPSLRYMTNSGGHFPESLVGAFRAAHPHVDLFLMYGLTEAFRSTYLPPDEIDARPGSMGRAIPDVEVLVVDEHGNECPPGQPGELVHRGAHVALGYWRDADATARVYRSHPRQREGEGRGETVVYSGDIVRKDEDGYLYFVGRRDQMIKSMGYRVSPEEIEHYVLASGLVAQAAAFAVAKDDVDTEIVVVVVPGEAYDEDRLVEYCRREMPEYMKPGAIRSVDALPETSSGKPDRPRLKEEYLAR